MTGWPASSSRWISARSVPCQPAKEMGSSGCPGDRREIETSRRVQTAAGLQRKAELVGVLGRAEVLGDHGGRGERAPRAAHGAEAAVQMVARPAGVLLSPDDHVQPSGRRGRRPHREEQGEGQYDRGQEPADERATASDVWPRELRAGGGETRRARRHVCSHSHRSHCSFPDRSRKKVVPAHRMRQM